jgi:hypothetical protein
MVRKITKYIYISSVSKEKLEYKDDPRKRILKLWSVISRCQRLILRSSALRYVS